MRVRITMEFDLQDDDEKPITDQGAFERAGRIVADAIERRIVGDGFETVFFNSTDVHWRVMDGAVGAPDAVAG